MGKADKRPWRASGQDWQQPASSYAKASWDYWPGAWKASPKARANKVNFPTYDRSWNAEEAITVVREERAPVALSGEESLAKHAQSAVNLLRKAEQRVAKIGKDQREKTIRFAAYEKQIRAAHEEEERRYRATQERLAEEMTEALQQQEAAKINLSKTMEALFGSGGAMDVSSDGRPQETTSWERMLQRSPSSSPPPSLDPELMEVLRQYKAGNLALRGPPPGLPVRAPEAMTSFEIGRHGNPGQVPPGYGLSSPGAAAGRPTPFPSTSPVPIRHAMEGPPTVGPEPPVDRGGEPALRPVELGAEPTTSPLAEQLRAKRQASREAHAPFGGAKSKEPAEPAPTGTSLPAANIIDDDREDLEAAVVETLSPAFSNLE